MKNLLKKELENRPDLLVIFDLIPEKSRIIDLGCGEGILLYHLIRQKKCYGCGVELTQEKIIECVARGVPVIHEDIDKGLNDYSDQCFDYVILSQTLQAVKRPDLLLKNMLRVGRKAVISFINIGHIRSRLQLAVGGVMPVTASLPYKWFETANIHLSTICDFRNICVSLGLKIEKEFPLGYRSHLLAELWPNIFASNCVFIVSKDRGSGNE
jgi:methionine biosynthesis protein MetW